MKEKETNNKLNNKMVITVVSLVLVVIAIFMILFLSKVEEHTIDFETNGGTILASIKVNKDHTIERPEDPVKEGYVFAGWYYNDEPFDFSKPVTEDMKLEAKWLEITDGDTIEDEDNPQEEIKDEEVKNEEDKKEEDKKEDNPKEETSKINVTGVSLDKTSLNLEVGENSKLTATVKPSNATNKNVTWSSNNTGVATVDSNGNVTAKKAGTATITVATKDGNYTAKVTVKVTEKEVVDTTVNVTGVALNKTSLTLTEGDSSKLTATVNPSNATNKNVTWSSNNTGVATVDSNGNVTAKNAGTATITVTTTDGGYTATCTVTVNEKPANYVVTISPINQPGIPVYQYTVTVTKNGSTFSSWKGVVFNNGAVVKPGGTLSSEKYDGVTSATIKLEDGTSVTATRVNK